MRRGSARKGPSARSVEIGELQDTFLVSAVTTILIIRLQLWATNYPSLGGSKLHIAHLLWGGLLMLVAIGLLITFVDHRWRQPAAVIGGAGFGFFIDEVGKFVTRDNNYFFKPSAAIIYIVFICLYFLTRWMRSRRGFSPTEYLANAIDLISDAAARGLTEHDRRQVLRFLRLAGDEPLVPAARELLERVPVIPSPERPRAERIAHGARRRYEDVSQRGWFRKTVVSVFLVYGGLTVFFVLLVAVVLLVAEILRGHISISFTVAQIGEAASDIVAAGLIVAGALRLRAHRNLDAYRLFYRALLVQIFIGQIFAFIDRSFVAVWGFLLSVALLISVRLMIQQEVRLEAERQHERAVAAGTEVAAAPVPSGAGG